MFDLLALVGALFLIYYVQLFRAYLSLPFARQRIRPCSIVPESMARMLTPWTEALQALGFSEPQWLTQSRVDGKPCLTPILLAYRHAETGTLAIIGPPLNIKRPDWPTLQFVDLLSSGQTAITQAFDATLLAMQIEGVQGRCGTESSIDGQWQAHRQWTTQLGGVSNRELGDPAAWLEAHQEQLRQTLIRRGWLKPLNDDLALPRLNFALRIHQAAKRMPKPAPSLQLISVERMALLARVVELVRENAPTRAAQWGMFLLSAALFALLGAVFWSIEFALIILLVVLIHELGHFMAMRAFGYRNVHMLALPLVGGVAIGQDVNPSALKRAWMSLMGPLPGIVIGWLLLAAMILGQLPEWMGSGYSLALMFLVINYLNVLPVPPLDGAHVVESLLPPRWARLQTLLIGSAAAIGALLAWHFEFYLLVAIALLQFPALRMQWQLHAVERDLSIDPAFAQQPRQTQIMAALKALARAGGPSASAVVRVNQALALVHRLQVKPMGGVARMLTGAVYLVLLAAPLSAGLWFWQSGQIEAETVQRMERQRATTDAHLAQARALPWRSLLAAEHDDLPLPEGASDAAIADAEQRLGITLPDELRELYRAANGAPALSIEAIEQISFAERFITDELAEYQEALSISLDDGSWVEIPHADAARWLHLGGDGEMPLFYLLTPDSRLGNRRFVEYFIESPTAYDSARDWAERQWVATLESKQSLRVIEAQRLALAETWQKASVPTLLEKLPEASWTERLVLRTQAPPGAADEADLTRVAQTLGVGLPDDLQAFYRHHDGLPALRLLPSAQLQRWREWRTAENAQWVNALFSEEHGTLAIPAWSTARRLERWSEADMASCVIVGAYVGYDLTQPRRPTLLWCPDGRPAPWIELYARAAYPSLQAWLVKEIVNLRAIDPTAFEQAAHND